MSKIPAHKVPKNAPGKFHTTEECDGCAYCGGVAPENFEYDKQRNKYFVGKQPATEEEEDYCLEAKDACPVDAIQVI